MNFIEFKQIFEKYPAFSVNEIKKYEPNFNTNNLVHWQKKKYLQKIRNGWYRINKPPENEKELFFIAGKIYAPSYISLESALAYHGLIPEQSFSVTSATSLKTQTFKTSDYTFHYQNLKPELMLAYALLPFKTYHFKMARPEKACLDFLYLHSEITSREDLIAMRLNKERAKEKLNRETLRQYADLFKSNTLEKKVRTLEQFIYA